MVGHGMLVPKKSEVKLVLYDQAVGGSASEFHIYETLPAWTHYEKIVSHISRTSDKVAIKLREHASMIEAALEISRTSLTSGHGQGLRDVVAPVDVLGGGEVRILSGRGQLT